MEDHIPIKRTPGYRDVRTAAGEPRAMFAPHSIVDEGRVRFVSPANGMQMGTMNDAATGATQPIIRIDHALGPNSLLFVPSLEELRVIASSATAMADDMEAAAADLLAEALKRKPGA